MSSNSKLYDKTIINNVNSAMVTPQSYKGFSTVSKNTDNYKLYDFYLIQQDILNNFNIRKGERLMNPPWGTIIWDLLFEQLTEDLKNLIVQDVNVILNNDPRVTATQVILTTYDTGLKLECLLTYLPYNISQKMRLNFDQKNGLEVY